MEVIDTLLGWCSPAAGARADHDACRYEVGETTRILRCTCPHHLENGDAA